MRPRSFRFVSLVILLLLSLGVPLVPLAAATGTAATVLLSRAYDGGIALTGGDSNEPSVSDDGRYVAFISSAMNFGAESRNDQIWVRDRLTGSTLLGSCSTSGTPSNAYNQHPTLSGNGRYLAWSSYATNLTPGSDGGPQVYLKDLVTGNTELVSVTPGGAPGNGLSGYNLAISQTGRYVAFSSYATNLGPVDNNSLADIYLRDRDLGACERISRGLNGAETNGDSGFFGLAVNADGSVVAFNSDASNLVANDTNSAFDTFVWERGTEAIERVSLTLIGEQPDSESRSVDVSADGRFVVFQSFAANMIPGLEWSPYGIYLRDRTLDATELVSVTSTGETAAFGNHTAPGISPDGRYVIFGTDGWELVPGDTNASSDFFVRDRQQGSTRRVSVAAGDTQTTGDERTYDRPDISTGGQVAVFSSLASDLVPEDVNAGSDIFAWESATGIARVSVGPSGEEALAPASSGEVAVSANGRYVAFVSDAFNLVAGDTNGTDDVFLTDRVTGALERVNVSSAGVEGNARGSAFYSRPGTPGVSGDGRYVAFWSTSDNLVPGDTNYSPDIFVRDRSLATTQRVSVNSDGSQTAGGSYNFADAAISEDGRYVAFASWSHDLAPGDENWQADAFVRDRLLGVTERVSIAADGAESNYHLDLDSRVAISGSGRQVAFVTAASNLTPGDTNGTLDVFVRDLAAGTTERASVGSGGQQGDGPSLSAALSRDGRYVAFNSFASDFSIGEPGDVHVRDRLTGTTLRASGATSTTQSFYGAQEPAVSADGRLVLFATYYSGLVTGDTNGGTDVFLRDRTLLATERISVSSEGAQSDGRWIESIAMSADARVAAFASDATNLTGDAVTAVWNVYARDRAVGRPFAPAGLTATAGSGEVLLLWSDQSPNETGFRVERDDGSGFATLITLAAGTTSHRDTGLADQTTYRYRVVAFNAAGEYGASNEAAATTLATIPAAPSGLAVGMPTATSLRLQWTDNSDNELGFRIERKRSGQPYAEIASVPAGAADYEDEGLIPDTLYYYQVRAYTALEHSAYSNAGSGTTLAAPPVSPTGLTAEALPGPMIRLTWVNESDTVDGFTVDRQVGMGAPERLGATDAVSYLDQTVQPNTEYRYSVRAFNAGGSSNPAVVTVTSPPLPPAAPSGLTARVRSAGSVQLDWQDNSADETGFKIEGYRDGVLIALDTVAAGANRWIDHSAPSGENIYYLRAIGAGGESARSNEARATLVLGGRLRITPARLSFKTVKRGRAKVLVVRLKNVGSAPLSGEIGLASAPYRVMGGGFFTISPNGTHALEVEFAPAAAGWSTRSLAITSTDAQAPARQVVLSGLGK